MRHNHNPKRLVLTAAAVIAVTSAALLPGIASADGGPKPRPQGSVASGIWVPQGSPLHGTATHGETGEQTYVRGSKPAGLIATTYGRGNAVDTDAPVDASDYLVLKR